MTRYVAVSAEPTPIGPNGKGREYYAAKADHGKADWSLLPRRAVYEMVHSLIQLPCNRTIDQSYELDIARFKCTGDRESILFAASKLVLAAGDEAIGNTDDLHPWGMRFRAGLGTIVNTLEYGRRTTYGTSSWHDIADGIPRYTSSLERHLNARALGIRTGDAPGLLSIGHAACNAMIVLQLTLTGAQ